MKRFFLILVTAVLFLTAVGAFADGVTFSTPYFSLELPDNWETDMEDLKKEDNSEELGFFGGETAEGVLTGGAYLVYYENLKDISLWNASEEELKDYADAVLEDFEKNNPRLVDTVMAGQIPLVIIRGDDDEGEFVYADTITNGYAIEFEFYVTDDDGEKLLPVTDQDIEQIKTILTTFRPATDAGKN